MRLRAEGVFNKYGHLACYLALVYGGLLWWLNCICMINKVKWSSLLPDPCANVNVLRFFCFGAAFLHLFPDNLSVVCVACGCSLSIPLLLLPLSGFGFFVSPTEISLTRRTIGSVVWLCYDTCVVWFCSRNEFFSDICFILHLDNLYFASAMEIFMHTTEIGSFLIRWTYK